MMSERNSTPILFRLRWLETLRSEPVAYAYAVAYAAYEASLVVLASFGPGFAYVLPAVSVAAVRSALVVWEGRPRSS